MKIFLFVLMLLLPVLSFGRPVELNEIVGKLYSQKNLNLPSEDVFKKALTGYYHLVQQNILTSEKSIITIIDFSLSSNKKRLWVIDLKNSKVLFHNYVSHGKKTGEEYAKYFSNTVHSNMSSLGFYKTGDRYIGKHGLSLHLHGLDKGFNDNAYERAIVMHSADYVSEDFIKKYGRLGRSFGCPAVSKKICKELIDTIADGTCMFIYFPDEAYLNNSVILNDLIQAKK